MLPYKSPPSVDEASTEPHVRLSHHYREAKGGLNSHHGVAPPTHCSAFLASCRTASLNSWATARRPHSARRAFTSTAYSTLTPSSPTLRGATASVSMRALQSMPARKASPATSAGKPSLAMPSQRTRSGANAAKGAQTRAVASAGIAALRRSTNLASRSTRTTTRSAARDTGHALGAPTPKSAFTAPAAYCVRIVCSCPTTS